MAWEPAQPTLPSISSHNAHLIKLTCLLLSMITMKLMRFRRVPGGSFVLISGIIAFAPIKLTLRESRHGRASPAMCCDHAVELT